LDKEQITLTSAAQEVEVNVNRQGWWINGIAFQTASETVIYENRPVETDTDQDGIKYIAPATFKAEWLEIIKVDNKTVNVKAQANNSGMSRQAQVSLSAGNTDAWFDITQQ
jgi:hypothetical protein